MRKTGVFIAACALSGVVSAQQPPASGACELHVWPGASLGSVYYGWLGSGINNGAVNGNPRYPQVPSKPLDTPVQAALLNEAQPQRLLGRDGTRLVVHQDALPSRIMRGTPGRIQPDAAPCYAELIVDTVTLRQDIVTGNHLLTLYRFRDFGSGNAPQRTFGTWVKTAVGKLDGPSDAGTAELRSAYRANLRLFAQALGNTRSPVSK